MIPLLSAFSFKKFFKSHIKTWDCFGIRSDELDSKGKGGIKKRKKALQEGENVLLSYDSFQSRSFFLDIYFFSQNSFALSMEKNFSK